MHDEFSSYLTSVEERYDANPYPHRRPEDERGKIYTTATEHLGKINHYCYRGKRDLRNGSRFLVAGGGTGDSAIYLAEQLRGHDAEIFYLDISNASLQVARERARFRELDNIHWLHGSLLDLPRMETGQFDYINCCGVLHHLRNPTAGMQALTQVLHADGCMGISVYARYGRKEIYTLQEMLQEVCSGTADLHDRISIARTILASLPDNHWLLRNKARWLDETREMGVDAMSDSAIFHLFLHTDHAYSIPQLYDWIAHCGLNLVTLTGFPGKTRKYDPASRIENPELRLLADSLPPRLRQTLGEVLDGSVISHTFYATRSGNTIAETTAMNNIPYFEYPFAPPEQLFLGLHNNPGRSMSIPMGTSQDYLVINQQPLTKFLLRYLDGERSLGEIFDCIRNDAAVNPEDASDAVLTSQFQALFDDINTWDMLLLRDRSIPRFKRSDELTLE